MSERQKALEGARRALLAPLVATLVLTLPACDAFFTSGEERAAREVALEKLRSTLASLPHPQDMTVARFPGTDFADVLYWGNYQARNAFLDAQYLTSLDPDEVCRTYLRFVESRADWQPRYPPCQSQPTRDAYVTNLGVRQKFPPPSKERFELNIVIRKRQAQPGAPPITHSEISLHMRYAADRQIESRCIPLEGAPPQELCASGEWRLPREIVTESSRAH